MKFDLVFRFTRAASTKCATWNRKLEQGLLLVLLVLELFVLLVLELDSDMSHTMTEIVELIDKLDTMKA